MIRWMVAVTAPLLAGGDLTGQSISARAGYYYGFGALTVPADHTMGTRFSGTGHGVEVGTGFTAPSRSHTHFVLDIKWMYMSWYEQYHGSVPVSYFGPYSGSAKVEREGEMWTTTNEFVFSPQVAFGEPRRFTFNFGVDLGILLHAKAHDKGWIRDKYYAYGNPGEPWPYFSSDEHWIDTTYAATGIMNPVSGAFRGAFGKEVFMGWKVDLVFTFRFTSLYGQSRKDAFGLPKYVGLTLNKHFWSAREAEVPPASR